MILEAEKKQLVVGYKQTMKAIAEKRAVKVYIARDSEERFFSSLADATKGEDSEIFYVDTMSELGKLCGIDKGATCAAVTAQV